MPTPQLVKIVTGGQTGADQGALLAARAAGVETGGWAPVGWMTEDGPAPWLADFSEDGPAPWLADFSLVECPTPGYKAHTQANARDSDATIWFGRIGTPGHAATITDASTLARTTMVVAAGMTRPANVVPHARARNGLVMRARCVSHAWGTQGVLYNLNQQRRPIGPAGPEAVDRIGPGSRTAASSPCQSRATGMAETPPPP